ncbi:lytic transglycosylase domain-containing protein [Parasphingorhabdus sp. DH2-15]|uniref:lytic transglycosylase domain-containing protein n=1 Tax=Parasphingorhabdus sp. DH2-15 TaxID=3444112 RepID=UPI003F68287B
MKSVLYSLSLFGFLCSPLSAKTSVEYFSAPESSDIADSHADVLSNKEHRQALSFFSALKKEDWNAVTAIIADSANNPLNPVFRAEYYLAANSPAASAEDLLALLQEAPDIAQSDQLRRLAARRGVVDTPSAPARRSLQYQGAPSVRGKPNGITGDNALAESEKQRILQAITNSDPDLANSILQSSARNISIESLTEWQQRVAWSYYIENRDREALEIAREAVKGRGIWLGESHWVYGLAAWRQGDYRLAAEQFSATGSAARNPELKSAGYYWASRAWMRAGYPGQVNYHLQQARTFDGSLYGLLAEQALGVEKDVPATFADISTQQLQVLKKSQNGQSALALISIGQNSLAEESLRYEARRAQGADHQTLLAVARAYNLPALQSWLAIYAPKNADTNRLAAFPAPRWQPVNGWKVDPALVYAHTLQESGFRPDAVSPANARGLMQLLPGTAADLGANYNIPSNNEALAVPENNLALGQQFLQNLAKKRQTGGLLPKVIAAYNAGPSPVGRWNDEIKDQGDPLLYMESIPYSETRAYVGIVLRNYWMYEAQAGIASQSAFGLAQGLWPKFPNGGAVQLVRIDPVNNGGSRGGDR